MIETDFLIVGSGLAGLSCARKLSKVGKVVVVTKRSLSDSATYYAQGGTACVWSREDSFRSHIGDTLRAGRGLCKKNIVEKVIIAGHACTEELIKMGVRFSKQLHSRIAAENDIELGLEGGHSRRRILHVEDKTGSEIENVLIRRVRKSKNIKIFENCAAIDLITKNKIEKKSGLSKNNVCYGAYVFNSRQNHVFEIKAAFTVLATGGAGKAYLYTSNPDVSTGDGIAMAYRAGAKIANMEFVQFHPTCLYLPGNAIVGSKYESRSFLISEALRGEGAILRLQNGKKFMKKYHRLGELAPRDIVARAIDSELKRTGDDFVYLDISHRPANFTRKRFPKIYKKCLSLSIDITKKPIPVVPSAHYFCGGVLIDEFGNSTIERLFAIGEVSCSGLHGANRLASNSLLECLTFAEFAAGRIKSLFQSVSTEFKTPKIPKWTSGRAADSDEIVVISQNWDEIRHFLWNYVGIVRSDKRLVRAKHRIELIKKEINDYYWNFLVNNDILELRNIAVVADLIIKCAAMRKESRGIHFNIDHPKSNSAFAKDTVIAID